MWCCRLYGGSHSQIAFPSVELMDNFRYFTARDATTYTFDGRPKASYDDSKSSQFRFSEINHALAS